MLTNKLTNEQVECIEENSIIRISTSAYEVIDGAGPLPQGVAFVVMNNIPVSVEGRGLFEARFMNRARKIENERGFLAIRICRPIDHDTYVVLTFWSDEHAYEEWRQSEAYRHAHRHRGTEEGIDRQAPSIFPRPSFVTTFEWQGV